ncbi:MAG TPA: PAS domain S-box protein, partial [Chthoniobacterales bacterium]|nr:PAS domain S-box protein [Chthoniobacterales bacterium]
MIAPLPTRHRAFGHLGGERQRLQSGGVEESLGIQLLIAEDSAIVRERLISLASEYLQPHAIQTAATGADAVAAFDRSRPDAVLLDIGLPDMSGLTVLEHIRRQGASTEVIVFTNSGSPEMVARCHLLGADHFVDKAQDVGPVIELLRTIAQPREKEAAGNGARPTLSPRTDKGFIPPERSTAKPVSLLLVEDDASQASALVRLLERKLPRGSTIVQARSLVPALELMTADTFQVVLLDLGLPDCEGVGALVAVRQANADTAIIVLTADDDESTVESAMVAGADDYFVKGELAVAGLTRAIIYAAEGKRSERALSAALESRTRIMDSSVDVICTLDAAGRFAEVGAASARIWGYEPAELVGRNAREWVADEDLSKTEAFFTTVRNGETVRGFEHRFVRSDGAAVPMMWSGAWSATDRLMYCVARDISELKRNEETLRATVESALDCIITIDESDTILQFNPAAEQTFGWSRAEAVGRTLVETIIPPQSRAGHARSMARLFEPGPSPLLGKRIEIMAMRSDGTEFPVELSLIRIGAERPARFTAFLRDISGRVTARQKLEAQEEQYRVLFEINPNAMWVYDLENLHVLAVNNAAIAQYGYSREEFHGLPLAAQRPAEERDRFVKAARAEGHASGPAGTWRHLRKDGTVILVDVYSSPTTFEGQPAQMAVLVDITEQKAAEEEIARRGHQLATERARLVEAQRVAKVGDWHVDFLTQTRTWSAETCRIFEVDPDQADVSHERFMTMVHPEDRAAVEAASEASLTLRSSSMLKHRLVMPDGRIKFIEQRWQVAYDENGKAIHATGTVQDITEREEAQEVLRRSERNLALAQIVSHTGSWEIVLDPTIAAGDRDLHWSDEEFRIFGFEPGAVQATQALFSSLVHADDRERVGAAFAAAFRSGEPYEIEHRILWPDGTQRHVHERAEFVSDEETGAVVRIIGTTQDITDRKQAEQTLLEQAEMLNLAHDAIVVGRCEDRVITFWNKGAEHLYGWSAAEVIGQRIDELLYPDGEQYDEVTQAVDARGGFRGELDQIAKDGRKLVVSARANKVGTTSGAPTSILIIQSDITEHKKLEQQFLRAQRLESIGTLASGVAHDLNNVLAPILMSVPLLRDDLPPALKGKIVDTIEKSAERGAQIVRQVLTFARGVEGERLLIDPSHLIKEMAQIVEETFPKTLEVTTRYPDDLALVEGDPTQLHQVLLNLAVNARDAMPSGGRLILAAENFDVDEHYAAMTPGTKPGPHVMITVSDTGTG